MNVQATIHKLKEKNILPCDVMRYEKLGGGSSSDVYLLTLNNHMRYVIKSNDKEVIKAEAYFLSEYKHLTILPQLIYVDEEYIVYEFQAGSTIYSRNNKKEMLIKLTTSLINHYQPAKYNDKWGFVAEETNSWQHFLRLLILDANETLEGKLPNEVLQNMLTFVSEKETYKGKPFLLHGDFGVHNFIFENGQLAGVIDPTPVLGDPLYDLLYAFCSSPDDLTKNTIDEAASHVTFGSKAGQALYEEVCIILYIRLATCLRHHPSDFKEYMKAWEQWYTILTVQSKG
jgi:fructosamine-3-kinase